MAKTTKYVADPSFIKLIAADLGVLDICNEAAQVAAKNAKELAPGDEAGQYYAEAGQLRSSQSTWHIIEYSSVNNPAYAPMRRGVIAAGLKFVD